MCGCQRRAEQQKEMRLRIWMDLFSTRPAARHAGLILVRGWAYLLPKVEKTVESSWREWMDKGNPADRESISNLYRPPQLLPLRKHASPSDANPPASSTGSTDGMRQTTVYYWRRYRKLLDQGQKRSINSNLLFGSRSIAKVGDIYTFGGWTILTFIPLTRTSRIISAVLTLMAKRLSGLWSILIAWVSLLLKIHLRPNLDIQNNLSCWYSYCMPIGGKSK